MTRHYFRSVSKDAKKKRYARVKSKISYNEFLKQERVDSLYRDYSREYDKLKKDYGGAKIDKWSRREFSEHLSSGEKKMTVDRFINRSVAAQMDVMPKSEAIRLRIQLAQAAKDAGDTERAIAVSEMSIKDVRAQPRLQSELYNYLRKSGMSVDESSSWWSENIIGSD